MNPKQPKRKPGPDADLNRRTFLEGAAGVTGAAFAASTLHSHPLPSLTPAFPDEPKTEYKFDRADSHYHGHQWQTLNPGFWKIQNGALRRRLHNYGDRARRTGFPFHAETHNFKFETNYDPSLDCGVIYTPQWNLSGQYQLEAEFTYRADRPAVPKGDQPDWKMYQDGYGLMGVTIGSKSVFQSYNRLGQLIRIGWNDKQQLAIMGSAKTEKSSPQGGTSTWNDSVIKSIDAMQLKPGDQCRLRVHVQPSVENRCRVSVTFSANGETVSLTHSFPSQKTEGFTGVLSRGLIDFEVTRLEVQPHQNRPLKIGHADCLVCYPLGDTLALADEKWHVRFVGMFASDGKKVEIRVADSPSPKEGWERVMIAGTGRIINNQWRRNTAVIDVTLPVSPSEQTLYYTVWKDGKNVTSDGRVDTDACDSGMGLVGEVPGGGSYVGRLPQLTAPYKLCGLSCHAINSGLQKRTEDGWAVSGNRDVWAVRDQPTVEAYQHLDDYKFQVMVWEDDVWYMELLMYPPSTDDAYKIVALSICGPTSRWQMMRHWNVINPGDHDYGMDDVKGPEQILIRKTEGLGQDPAYMRRNFQIVHHLTTGAEQVDPYENPKKWRAWKMPNRDFTFVILDSRLWRSSQDVDIWDDQGWNQFKSLYDRTDPTRSLLGEEQFGWLQSLLTTDSSPLICLTGINGLHTIWAGAKNGETASKNHPQNFSQRDRVTADYAGWVKAGSDRVIELLGQRDGIVSVYGDVHNGCIMKNLDHGLIECSFGPIGRSGGRALIPGFGQQMKDVDGRVIQVHALYHKDYASPDQEPHASRDPFYWNFLEMEFDPAQQDPNIQLRIRNLVDSPSETPRGGGDLDTASSRTGRTPTATIPSIRVLPNADVHFYRTDGSAIRGTRSNGQGEIAITGLIDIPPGTRVIVNAFDGTQSESKVIQLEDRAVKSS